MVLLVLLPAEKQSLRQILERVGPDYVLFAGIVVSTRSIPVKILSVWNSARP